MPDISWLLSKHQYTSVCQQGCLETACIWRVEGTVNSYPLNLPRSLGISDLWEDEQEGLPGRLNPESSHRKRRNHWGTRDHTQHFTVCLQRPGICGEWLLIATTNKRHSCPWWTKGQIKNPATSIKSPENILTFDLLILLLQTYPIIWDRGRCKIFITEL